MGFVLVHHAIEERRMEGIKRIGQKFPYADGLTFIRMMDVDLSGRTRSRWHKDVTECLPLLRERMFLVDISKDKSTRGDQINEDIRQHAQEWQKDTNSSDSVPWRRKSKGGHNLLYTLENCLQCRTTLLSTRRRNGESVRNHSFAPLFE